MLDPVETQLWRLSVLFVLGTGCNVIFHLYTAIRAVTRPGKVLRHLFDWVTAMLVLGLALAVVFIVSYGEMRIYIPVSIAAGFFISQLVLGQLLYSIFYSTIKGLVTLLRWTKTHLIAPLMVVLTWPFRAFRSRPKPPENLGGPDTSPEEPPNNPPKNPVA